jgi:hypothetical protein
MTFQAPRCVVGLHIFIYQGDRETLRTDSARAASPPQLDFERSNRLRYVNSSDKATAFVRTGLGAAVVPEVYCKRKLITAFKLVPATAFTRYIGACYSTQYPLSRSAFYLLHFIRTSTAFSAISALSTQHSALPATIFVGRTDLTSQDAPRRFSRGEPCDRERIFRPSS